MGVFQFLAVLRALPPERRSEIFDFVEFVAARCGVDLPSPTDDWTDAEFSEMAMRQALRGIEEDDIVHGPDDVKIPISPPAA